MEIFDEQESTTENRISLRKNLLVTKILNKDLSHFTEKLFKAIKYSHCILKLGLCISQIRGTGIDARHDVNGAQ